MQLYSHTEGAVHAKCCKMHPFGIIPFGSCGANGVHHATQADSIGCHFLCGVSSLCSFLLFLSGTLPGLILTGLPVFFYPVDLLVLLDIKY